MEANMKQVIYIDVLIALNIIIGWLLILAASKILRVTPTPFRLLFASFLSGVYSLLILAPEMMFIISLLIKLILSVSIVAVAFKPTTVRELIRYIAAFFLVNFTFAGIMMAIYFLFKPRGMAFNNGAVYFNFSFTSLLACAAAAYVLVSLFGLSLKRKSADGDLYDVEIKMDGKTVSAKGFMDSGNNLYDSFSGSPVIISDPDFIKPLIPKALHKFFDGDYDTAYLELFPDWKKRVRLIPAISVNGSGLLAAFSPDSVTITSGEKAHTITNIKVAVSREKFSNGEYAVLLNPEVFMGEESRRRLKLSFKAQQEVKT